MLSRNLIRTSAWLLLALFAVLALHSEASALTKRRLVQFSPNWSFQLAYDGYLGDNDHSGVRFSLTRHLTQTDALRFSIGVYHRDNWIDEAKRYETNGLIFTFDNYYPFDVDGGYAAVQYLAYAHSSPQMSLYWGLGPRFSVEEANPSLAINNATFPYQWVEWVECRDSQRLGLGLEGSLGLELFIGRHLSVNAEYGVTIEHRWYHFDMEYSDGYGYSITEDEFVADGLHLDASHIRLGVSMYF